MITALNPTLKTLHWQGTARQLQDALPFQESIASITDFLNTMAYLGYDNRQQICYLADITRFPVLVIGSNQANKPFIIVDKQADYYQGYDIETGQPVAVQQAEELYTTYTFTPIVEEDDEAELQAKARTGLTWFRDIYNRFTGLFWQVALSSILIQFGTLTVPIFVMIVYNQVIGAQAVQALPFLLVGVLLFLTAEALLRYMRLHALSWFGSRINAIVSAKIFEQLLFLPPQHTERVSVSAQLARLKAFESVRDFFTGSMFLTLIDLPFLIILILGIGMIAGGLVWIIVAVACLYLFMLMATRQAVRYHAQRAAKSSSEKQHLIVETFSNLEAIIGAGMNKAWQTRYRLASEKSADAALKSGQLTGTLEHLAQGISMLAGIALLVFGVDLVWQKELSVGALVGTMILSWRVLNPLQTACIMLPKLVQIRASIEQVNQLMEMETERKPYQTALVYKPFDGHVQFSGVSLRYSKDIDPVFSGLSFQLEPGQFLAIAGGNGTGKTSILKLMAGLYRPQLGTIRIDNTDIRQIDPIVLRRSITYIPQYAQLFSGSILDNLRLTNPELDQEQAKAILQKADAWKAVQQLPAGMDTQVHNTLPAQLKSKINLARLYADNHKIILCDERSQSVLNGQAGLLFKQFLNDCKGKKTIIMVTPRQDYLEIADKVLYLERDRRPVLGTPDQLSHLFTGGLHV